MIVSKCQLSNSGVVRKSHSITVTETYVDGSRIGDISGAVLNDRKIMANDGILVVILNINFDTRKIVAKPLVTTRGFILISENEELIKSIEKEALKITIRKLKDPKATYNDIKTDLSKDISYFIKEKVDRRPIVLPIILNVKK